MSYNGSGTFQINSTGQPVVGGTIISSATFNALTADLATGLTTAITKDGQTATTARIPFAQGINSTLVTDASSVSTGSIITAGGVGIAKALYVGGALNYGGVTLTNAVTGTGKMVLDTNPSVTNPTVTAYTETIYALSGTAIDPANGTIQTKTLGANTTFTESLANGQSIVLMLNPVTYTVTWPTMTWINTAGSGSAPTLEASSTNVVVIWQVAGTVYGNWAGSA